MNQGQKQPRQLEGQVRLFPLPDLVLFPGVHQPLHIFEPRYQQLMTDSLAADRQFAMAVLRPGWERDYDRRPPIYSAVCVGEIRNEERFADGRYNLVLRGLRRGIILEEMPHDRLYRVAQVRWLEDIPVSDPCRQAELTRRLEQGLLDWASNHCDGEEPVRQLLDANLSPGSLCDVLGFVLPMPLETQVELLGQPYVESRLRQVLAYLEDQSDLQECRDSRVYPPEFSLN